jgi:very-short-patch-repair endonuclease
VTPVARTVVDLSSVVSPWRLERTIDQALLESRTSVPRLAAEIARAERGHQARVGLVRELVADRGDGYVPPESELEAELYGALESPLLPGYVRQAILPWWSPASLRVDALIPEWQVIVVIDGRRWHTRVRDFERDRARDHLAQRRGYEVVRFTFRQVRGSGRYVVELLLEIGAHRQILAPR